MEVDKPTEALEAQEAADDTLTTLFLGLGAVSLLAGGVGIANIKGWETLVPPVAVSGGIAGLYRAVRVASLSPPEAFRTTQLSEP